MTAGEDPSSEAPVAFSGELPPADGGASSPGSLEPPLEAPAEAPVGSFVEDLRDLAGDAQTLFEAEKAYQSARLSYALSRGKGVALSFAVAGVLVYFATIAAVVGLLLALAPLLTAWGALAVVTLSLAVLALLFFRAGMKRLRRMRTFLGAAAASGAAS